LHPDVTGWPGQFQPTEEDLYHGLLWAQAFYLGSNPLSATYPVSPNPDTFTTCPNTDLSVTPYFDPEISPGPPPCPDPGDSLHHPIEYHDPDWLAQADHIDSVPTGLPASPQFEISAQTRVSVQEELWHCEEALENGTKCGKMFGRHPELSRHKESVHTDKRRQACPYCPNLYLFSRKDTLLRHIRRIHPEKLP
jgi:uncharacterized Zn-finger protein